ncbi:MAG: hypothetical protein IJJ40_00865 [Clostridia bacterium]|nr:hypothetical protein [Clostridia bacterium]
MSYLVQGYCFISVFIFITKDSNDRTKTSLLLPSVTTSYILKLVYDKTIILLLQKAIVVNFNSAWYYIGLILFSIILAYLLGIFVLSKPFNTILVNLHVPHSINSNFWLDIYKSGTWLNVYLKGQDVNILGQIKYIEENQRNPYVCLSNYSIYDKRTGEEQTITVQENEEHSIILELKDIEYIKVIDIKKTSR